MRVVSRDNVPPGHVTVRDLDVRTLKDAVVIRGKLR